VLFASDDGLNWRLARRPFITAPEVTWQDGRQEQLAQLERPQLWFEDGRPAILFCAADETSRRSASFNLHIPLKSPSAR